MSVDALVQALIDDDFISFLFLMDDASDLNSFGVKGMTPLIAAIKYDRMVPFIHLIQDKRTDLAACDKEGYDPMYHAIKSGKIATKVMLQGEIRKKSRRSK